MYGPLAPLFDAFAVFSEHREEGERPELYALHPEDHERAVEALGLEPDGRGGYSRWHARLGWIGPTIVADRSIPRGTARAWADVGEYLSWRGRRPPEVGGGHDEG